MNTRGLILGGVLGGIIALAITYFFNVTSCCCAFLIGASFGWLGSQLGYTYL